MSTTDPTKYPLRQIHVSGTSREMGRQHGEVLRPDIVAFVGQRLQAAQLYLAERGKGTLAELVDTGALCLARAEAWDPEGTDEHLGIAEGAGVSPVELYTAANMTDVRDVVLLGDGPHADAEGCSTVLLPPAFTRDHEVLCGETWDLNPGDLDYVVAIHRLPTAGPETWSVTCCGCLTLVGMNAHGVSVGTNNLKVTGARPGVGYMTLLHRALRCESYRRAAELLVAAPRAAAHAYWLADETGAVELECSAWKTVSRPVGAAPVVRTNHCLAPEHRAAQGEPPYESSLVRFERLTQRLSEGRQDVASLRELFADRSDGVNSISRFPEDNQGTATNAVVLCEPKLRRLSACRGPAQRGQWVELRFER